MALICFQSYSYIEKVNLQPLMHINIRQSEVGKVFVSDGVELVQSLLMWHGAPFDTSKVSVYQQCPECNRQHSFSLLCVFSAFCLSQSLKQMPPVRNHNLLIVFRKSVIEISSESTQTVDTVHSFSLRHIEPIYYFIRNLDRFENENT